MHTLSMLTELLLITIFKINTVKILGSIAIFLDSSPSLFLTLYSPSCFLPYSKKINNNNDDDGNGVVTGFASYSVDNQLRYAKTQLDRLKKTNVFNTTFHIW